MKKIIVILMMIFIYPTIVYGNDYDTSILDEQIDAIDFKDINEVLKKKNVRDAISAYDSLLSNSNEVSIESLAYDVINGKLDISFQSIISGLLKLLSNEILSNTATMRNMIIIAILSGFLKNLTDSFNNKSVGELGFYVSYLTLIIVLFSTFNLAATIVNNLISILADFCSASIPILMSLVLFSGNFSTAYVINPIFLFLTNVVTSFIQNLIVPAIVLIATIQIINYLTEKEVLTKAAELLKKGIQWILRSMAILFITILSIQRISAPVMDNVLSKTLKTAIHAVPVVGSVFTGAVDTVLYWSSAVKSGVIVAILIFAIVLCVIPVMKVVAMILIYKLTAAIIQPICDDRIVKCIDAIGTFMFLLLGASVTVIFMFIFSLMVVLSL